MMKSCSADAEQFFFSLAESVPGQAAAEMRHMCTARMACSAQYSAEQQSCQGITGWLMCGEP